jgi:predicted transcriptional regulator
MNRMKKHKTSISVSEEGERLLRLLAEKLAINRSAVLEIALRKMAKVEGIR